MSTSNAHPEPDHPRTSKKVRVLVAFEDERRVYREIIARAMTDLRPAITVRPAALADLERELGRFDPHVVVSSKPNAEYPGGRGAWVRIPTDDEASEEERLAQICLEGENWRADGPPLDDLLGVIDEAEERLREGDLTEVC